MALSYPTPEEEPLPASERPEPEQSESEPAEAGAAEAVEDRPQAPQITPPSGSRRFIHNLFGRETRSGRFLRALLRGLAIFVFLVALGGLAVYLALARPAEEQLRDLRAQATQAASDLQRVQQERDRAVEQLRAADDRAIEASERLTLEVTRNAVLRATTAVSAARLSVALEDRDAAARALAEAEDAIEIAKPGLDKLDPSHAQTFSNLFSLARSDLERDLTFAAQDLERLSLELSRLDEALQ